MIIYIRHSHDEEGNPEYRHDPVLTKHGEELAREAGKKLLDKYGVPDHVYVSPFRRTKYTMKAMLGKDVSKTEIHVDSRLARFFSSNERKDHDVNPKTLRHKIDIEETKEQFSDRVKEFTKFINAKNNNKVIIWCITHTSTYKVISHIYGIDLPEEIPYMYYVKIRNKV